MELIVWTPLMNRLFARCLCVCFAPLSLAAPFLSAQEDDSLHLIEVLDIALANNPLLGSEISKLNSLRAEISEARAGWLPTVTANYDESQSNSSYTYQSGETRNDDDPSSAQSIIIRQPLWDWGKTKANVESARARFRSGESTLSLVEGRVLMEALDAFFGVQRDREVMRAAAQSADVMQQQVDATEQRLAAGATILTDEARVRARLYSAEGQRAQAEGALAKSLAAFERATSISNPGNLIGIVPDNVEGLADVAEDEWAEHPSVMAAKASERSAYQSFKSEQRSIWPDISLTGQVRKIENTGSSYVSELDESSFGFKFDAPIYQGGAQFARARRARALWESAQFGVQDSERKAREGAIAAARIYHYSRQRLNAATEQVQASERAFLLMKEEVAAARKSLVDQLDAQNELLDARTNLAYATRDSHVAAWTVLFALGRLDAEWLAGMKRRPLPK